MVYLPAETALNEIVAYVNGPARAVKAAYKEPEKSALEMGKINESFLVFVRVRPLLSRELQAGARNCFEISDIKGHGAGSVHMHAIPEQPVCVIV